MVLIRMATPADRDAVAALHTANWQDAYRGLLPDAYLDGPLAADMQAAWAEKFADSAAGRSGVLVAEEDRLVAEEDRRLLGFIRIVPNADPRWGHYIDNLHVAAGGRGRGVGRTLFQAGADWARTHGGAAGLYLYVYADNTPARAAYARWQGREVEHFLDDAPHGGKIPAVRVVWEAGAGVE